MLAKTAIALQWLGIANLQSVNFCHCTPLLTAANVGFQRRFEQHIFELISNAILATMIHPYFKLRWGSTKSTEKYAHYCSKKRLSCSAKCAGPVYEWWHRRWLFLHLLTLMTQKHHNRQLMQWTSVTSKYCSLLKITGREGRVEQLSSCKETFRTAWCRFAVLSSCRAPLQFCWNTHVLIADLCRIKHSNCFCFWRPVNELYCELWN